MKRLITFIETIEDLRQKRKIRACTQRHHSDSAVRYCYEGDHISARFDGKHTVTIRNKDNICSATIAHNQKIWGVRKTWCLFMTAVSKTDTFTTAVDYFEQRGIKMLVSG